MLDATEEYNASLDDSRTLRREASLFLDDAAVAASNLSLSQLTAAECDTVDVSKVVVRLKQMVNEETFLPINTSFWEDQIIIEVAKILEMIENCEKKRIRRRSSVSKSRLIFSEISGRSE